jgi:hypothetical protein
MSKWIKRQEFEAIFAPINAQGKNIWAIHRIKKLPSEIIEMAMQLSTLDFINYIRLTDEILAASSELKGLRKAGVIMDWSGGFWDKIKAKHNKID